MEPLENQRQIWQRVCSPEPPRERMDLRDLALRAGETEAALRRAAGQLAGSQRQQAITLAGGAGEEVAVLKGIHYLDTGETLRLKPVPAPGGSIRALLRECYFRCLRAQGEYTARTLEPRFGGTFQSLAQQNQLRCLALARLLGMLA